MHFFRKIFNEKMEGNHMGGKRECIWKKALLFPIHKKDESVKKSLKRKDKTFALKARHYE